MKYLKVIIPIAIILITIVGIFFLVKSPNTQANPTEQTSTPSTQVIPITTTPSLPSDISKIPILTYHSFGPAPERKESSLQLHYRITAKMFDAQMKYLVDNGYKTITFADLVENQINGKPIPDKAIVLTFDDGWKNQYDFALPILEKYKLTGTFFIITGATGTRSYMSVDELKDLHTKGFEIASHTISHPKLTTLDEAKLIMEINSSKVSLEEKLGITIKTIAYPYYTYNEHVMDIVKQAGYLGARGGWSKSPNDTTRLFELKSQEPVNNPNPFAEKRLVD